MGLSLLAFVRTFSYIDSQGTDFFSSASMAFSNVSLCVIFIEITLRSNSLFIRLFYSLVFLYTTLILCVLLYYVDVHGIESVDAVIDLVFCLFFYIATSFILSYGIRGMRLPIKYGLTNKN
ncbi:MAG: hypothetical protein OXE77_10340 [Flavobacteriaceae bacterium]|nr:hypothetical protein [Flavobacteriaceae bacterium]MCY4266430.1 hypothetical protein [Flavobacteriaceae bacterium]